MPWLTNTITNFDGEIPPINGTVGTRTSNPNMTNSYFSYGLNRMAHLIKRGCRMMFIGDSFQVSFMEYGRVRRWKPDRWKGHVADLSTHTGTTLKGYQPSCNTITEDGSGNVTLSGFDAAYGSTPKVYVSDDNYGGAWPNCKRIRSDVDINVDNGTAASPNDTSGAGYKLSNGNYFFMFIWGKDNKGQLGDNECNNSAGKTNYTLGANGWQVKAMKYGLVINYKLTTMAAFRIGYSGDGLASSNAANSSNSNYIYQVNTADDFYDWTFTKGAGLTHTSNTTPTQPPSGYSPPTLTKLNDEWGIINVEIPAWNNYDSTDNANGRFAVMPAAKGGSKGDLVISNLIAESNTADDGLVYGTYGEGQQKCSDFNADGTDEHLSMSINEVVKADVVWLQFAANEFQATSETAADGVANLYDAYNTAIQRIIAAKSNIKILIVLGNEISTAADYSGDDRTSTKYIDSVAKFRSLVDQYPQVGFLNVFDMLRDYAGGVAGGHGETGSHTKALVDLEPGTVDFYHDTGSTRIHPKVSTNTTATLKGGSELVAEFEWAEIFRMSGATHIADAGIKYFVPDGTNGGTEHVGNSNPLTTTKTYDMTSNINLGTTENPLFASSGDCHVVVESSMNGTDWYEEIADAASSTDIVSDNTAKPFYRISVRPKPATSISSNEAIDTFDPTVLMTEYIKPEK